MNSRRCVATRIGGELCETLDPIDDGDRSTMAERKLNVGSARCRCGRCGRHFGGVGGFDKHQRLDDAGDVLCIYPGDVGMVVTTDGLGGWWSTPYAKGDDA